MLIEAFSPFERLREGTRPLWENLLPSEGSRLERVFCGKNRWEKAESLWPRISLAGQVGRVRIKEFSFQL